MRHLFEDIRLDASARGRDPSRAVKAGAYDDAADTRVFSFQDPPAADGESWADQVMDVPIGGHLWRLAYLGARLTCEYGWNSSEATTFVLCGETPYWNPLLLESHHSQ
jgi:hypothetical protein